eukprot:8673104-Pyramimonas_sp.AAC.1
MTVLVVNFTLGTSSARYCTVPVAVLRTCAGPVPRGFVMFRSPIPVPFDEDAVVPRGDPGCRPCNSIEL